MAEGFASYSELVRARFVARPFARLALAVLFALVGVSVCAPLIANDRPLHLRAVDRAGYEAARRTLVVVARELELAWSAPERDEAALRRGLGALELRAATLARLGGEAVRERLAPLVASARGSGPLAGEAAAWSARVAEVAAELAPRDASRPGGIELAATSSYPALAALSAGEGFALGAWWAALAAWCLARARRTPRARRDAGGAWRVSLAFVLVSGGAAALAVARLADPATPSGAAQKLAATRGELLVERALFAPIPFGFGETKLGEAQRPPTWWPKRAAGADAEPEPVGALVSAPTEVEVLFGERALEDPWRHPFGTDSLGRDLVARCVWGARSSLAIGAVVAAVVALVGTAIGAAAGHFRGWFDALASRVIEVVQCVPSFFLAVLALSAVRVEGADAALAVAAVIAAFGWTQIARLVRAEFLRSAELDWVLAARAVGVSPARLVCLHVLPHALSPAIVAAVFAVAGAILLESALSFLGVGLAEPVPSWGSVLGDAPSADVWWTVLFPGLFLFATVLAVHRAGEALREALDPRTQP